MNRKDSYILSHMYDQFLVATSSLPWQEPGENLLASYDKGLKQCHR